MKIVDVIFNEVRRRICEPAYEDLIGAPIQKFGEGRELDRGGTTDLNCHSTGCQRIHDVAGAERCSVKLMLVPALFNAHS